MTKRRIQEPTMDHGFHGSLANPHWLDGRRVLYLRVPFTEKDAAKAPGACYNPQRGHGGLGEGVKAIGRPDIHVDCEAAGANGADRLLAHRGDGVSRSRQLQVETA
jgi:hypothetical protein